MKRIFLIVICSLMLITGCANTEEVNDSNEVVKSVKAIINGKEYIIDLEDNSTTKSFVKILPKKFEMSDLNNNEKYIYLDTSLPTNPYNPKEIERGDVMLFGNDCLVIFYRSFNTSFSYTKIGHIDNLPDLGKENIVIKIER